MRILPKSWIFQSLRDLPGNQNNIFMSMAWGIAVVVLPVLDKKNAFNAALLFVFYSFSESFLSASHVRYSEEYRAIN